MNRLSKKILLLVFLSGGCTLFGQGIANYVSNGSFEKIKSISPPLPSDWSATNSTKFFGQLLIPPGTVPNSSYGFQYPKQGQNHLISLFYYVSGPNIYRSYPRNTLKDTLVNGKEYCFSMHLNLSDNSTVGIDALGAYFGDASLDTILQCNIPLTYLSPQVSNATNNFIADSMNWLEVKGTFVANGTEIYMLIGNFKSDFATNKVVVNPTHLPVEASDYLIDDVSVVDMDLQAFAGNDTNIVIGDSVFIGRQPDVGIDYACQWFQLPNDTIPIDTVAGLWVKPTTKTTYVVKQQLWCSGVKWDTVTIHFNTVDLSDLARRRVKIHPNPSSGEMKLCGLVQGNEYTLKILDIGGRVLYNSTFQAREDCVNISTELPGGVYQVVCDSGGEVCNERLIIRSH